MSGFYKLTLDDVELKGKTVLVRADYNVPIRDDGTIGDDYRIRSSVYTIRKLLEEQCKVVIISHLGRPDGQPNAKYTLEPAGQRLAQLLGRPVSFIDKCIGHKVSAYVKKAPLGSVILLENLRFHPEEEADDDGFAKQLAQDSMADYFVQDGFGVVHRAHASTHAITKYLPSVAGCLLEREYTTITNAMQHPNRPLIAIMGGAKISDKIAVIEAMVDVADKIIIGGAMANTFLFDKGLFVGDSKYEPDQGETIKRIYQKAADKVGRENVDDFLVLPSDVGVGRSTESTATRQDVSSNVIPAGSMALDLGPKTVEDIRRLLEPAKTVIWNGTLGFAEVPVFAESSRVVAEVLASRSDILSIIGGGDTADFVLHWDPKGGASFSHVSTGGGASLELMGGLKLPGVECLLDARR